MKKFAKFLVATALVFCMSATALVGISLADANDSFVDFIADIHIRIDNDVFWWRTDTYISARNQVFELEE